MSATTLSTLLVDDEPHALTNLAHMLEMYCHRISISGMALSAPDAIQKINIMKPDVVFMDVNMPGKDGFSVLNDLDHMPFLVFVTAHQHHALQALKVSAVDFILKPIDPEELKITEQKLLQLYQWKQIAGSNYNSIISNFFAQLKKNDAPRKIALYTHQGYALIDVDEIVFLTGLDNYTRFHMKNKKEIMIPKTLKEYEEMLEKSGFMRIHKSYIANLNQIKHFRNENYAEIEMSTGEWIPVSRRKTKPLADWIKNKR